MLTTAEADSCAQGASAGGDDALLAEVLAEVRMQQGYMCTIAHRVGCSKMKRKRLQRTFARRCKAGVGARRCGCCQQLLRWLVVDNSCCGRSLKQLALSGTHSDMQDAMMMVQDEDTFEEAMTRMTDQPDMEEQRDDDDNDDNDDMPPPEAMEAPSPARMQCRLALPC